MRKDEPNGSQPSRPGRTVEEYVEGIRAGSTAILAQALTLAESTNQQKQALAESLLAQLMPDTGGAIRVGVTGPPGAGKSTLIETLGLRLVDAGRRVAVLAIDPSSEITGGSILGDKTRMPRLAASANAFIRPSPSSGALGGAALRTRECMLLFEAAGYDVVIVETVGVGQSESVVAQLTDLVVAVMLPSAGDELQGIKKGLLEYVDLVLVNKADGDLVSACEVTAQQYKSALHTAANPSRVSEVMTCSALGDSNIDLAWERIAELHAKGSMDGSLASRRQQQNLHWLWAIVESQAVKLIRRHPRVMAEREELERCVKQSKRSAEDAARAVLKLAGLL